MSIIRTTNGLMTGPSAPRATRSNAFSLVEMIGVLAILAILAAALMPVVIRQVDRAAWTQETINLAAISNALVLQAVRCNNIPSQATWAQAAANWLTLPLSNITTTPRGYSRAYLIDPALQIGGGGLPYTQTAAGTTCPANARVMVISTIARALPVASGTTNTFSDIWNTPDGVNPASWAAWPGNGADVLIQRINLQPLFHRLILFDRDTTTNAALSFAIDGVTTNAPSLHWDSYYLDGSLLGLYTNSAPPSLLLTEVINRDLGLVFDNNVWGDQIGPGSPSAASLTLDQLAYAFITSPYPPVTKKGDNTIGVADALLAYMNAYSSWANMSPCFSYSGNGNNGKVVEYQLMNTVVSCFGGSAFGTCNLVP